jgi:hypothetical protein
MGLVDSLVYFGSEEIIWGWSVENYRNKVWPKKKKTLFRNKLSKGFGFGCRVHIRHDVWYDEPPFLT